MLASKPTRRGVASAERFELGEVNSHATSGVSVLDIAWVQANTANVAKATAQPPANPFSAKKEIRRGKSQKKGKGAAGGVHPPRRTGGAAQS